MSITPTKAPKGDITPAGNHIARLYSIIHIGTLNDEYMGEPKQTNTVRLGFELPNETKVFKEGDEAKPFVISQDFTLSLGEKANLGKLVRGMKGEAWGPNFDEEQDITALMGTACMLNVIHKESAKGTTYAKIESAAPMPKGVPAPDAVNAPFLLDYNDNWSLEKYGTLPEFIREKMQTTPEYRSHVLGEAPVRTDRTPVEGKEYASSLSGVDYPGGEGVRPEDIPF